MATQMVPMGTIIVILILHIGMCLLPIVPTYLLMRALDSSKVTETLKKIALLSKILVVPSLTKSSVQIIEADNICIYF